ncbi:MAG: chitobiase/beta-hexosaminidase C-terminal domain-containing protein [Spirochaetota bacterium]
METVNQRINGPSWAVRCASNEVDTSPPVIHVSPAGGAFGEHQTVTLTADENDVQIYYTTDGITEPDGNTMRYTAPIEITQSTVLKFVGVDAAGNRSTVGQVQFVIDTNLPTVQVLALSRDAVSGDISRGPSQAYDIHFTANYAGSYRIELGGAVLNGVPQKGSGFLLKDGTLGENAGNIDTTIASLLGSDLVVGPNSIYIYLTNSFGHTGAQRVLVTRDDTPPQTVSDAAGGTYAAAQLITLTMTNEPPNVGYIDYTTDGSDPTAAPLETDLSRCSSNSPFRPRSGYRCRIQGRFTSPIRLEPYMKVGCHSGTDPVVDPLSCDAGCTLGTDCNENVRLRYVGIDKAGNVENPQYLDFTFKMVDPRLLPATLSATKAGVNSSVRVTIQSTDDLTEWQLALGTGAVWNSGTVVYSGTAVTAMQDVIREIPGSLLSFGISNAFVVRGRDQFGRVGTTTFTLTRDDRAPKVSASAPSGTYNTGILPTVTLAIDPADSDAASARIYYTTDTESLPTPASNYAVGTVTVDLSSIYLAANPPGQTASRVTIPVRFYAIDPAGNQSVLREEVYVIQPPTQTLALQPTSYAPKSGNVILVTSPGTSTLSKWKNLNPDPVDYKINLVDLAPSGASDCTNSAITDTTGDEYLSGTLQANAQVSLLLPVSLIPDSHAKPALCAFAKRTTETQYSVQSLLIEYDRTPPNVSGFSTERRRLAVNGAQVTSLKFRSDETGVYNVWKMVCPVACKRVNGVMPAICTAQGIPEVDPPRWSVPIAQEQTAILASGQVTTADTEVNVTLSATLFVNDTSQNPQPECIAITVQDAMGNTSSVTNGSAYYSKPQGFDAVTGGDADSGNEGWFYRKDAASTFQLASAVCNNDTNCLLRFNRPGLAGQTIHCTGTDCRDTGNAGSVGVTGNLAQLPLTHIESIGGNGAGSGGGVNTDFGWLQSYIVQGHSVSVTGTTGNQKLYFPYWSWQNTRPRNSSDESNQCRAEVPTNDPGSSGYRQIIRYRHTAFTDVQYKLTYDQVDFRQRIWAEQLNLGFGTVWRFVGAVESPTNIRKRIELAGGMAADMLSVSPHYFADLIPPMFLEIADSWADWHQRSNWSGYSTAPYKTYAPVTNTPPHCSKIANTGALYINSGGTFHMQDGCWHQGPGGGCVSNIVVYDAEYNCTKGNVEYAELRPDEYWVANVRTDNNAPYDAPVLCSVTNSTNSNYTQLYARKMLPRLFGNYAVTASGSTTANYNVDWDYAQLKTHSYQGSKVFTYTNPHGVKTNLLVSCEKNAGCSASPF